MPGNMQRRKGCTRARSSACQSKMFGLALSLAAVAAHVGASASEGGPRIGIGYSSQFVEWASPVHRTFSPIVTPGVCDDRYAAWYDCPYTRHSLDPPL